VNWDLITKHLTVELDGQTMYNKGFVLSPLPKKSQLDIGSSETHHVEVSAGPFQPIELKADGEKVRPLL
jgi:hypothetical protein